MTKTDTYQTESMEDGMKRSIQNKKMSDLFEKDYESLSRDLKSDPNTFANRFMGYYFAWVRLPQFAYPLVDLLNCIWNHPNKELVKCAYTRDPTMFAAAYGSENAVVMDWLVKHGWDPEKMTAQSLAYFNLRAVSMKWPTNHTKQLFFDALAGVRDGRFTNDLDLKNFIMTFPGFLPIWTFSSSANHSHNLGNCLHILVERLKLVVKSDGTAKTWHHTFTYLIDIGVELTTMSMFSKTAMSLLLEKGDWNSVFAAMKRIKCEFNELPNPSYNNVFENDDYLRWLSALALGGKDNHGKILSKLWLKVLWTPEDVYYMVRIQEFFPKCGWGFHRDMTKFDFLVEYHRLLVYYKIQKKKIDLNEFGQSPDPEMLFAAMRCFKFNRNTHDRFKELSAKYPYWMELTDRFKFLGPKDVNLTAKINKGCNCGVCLGRLANIFLSCGHMTVCSECIKPMDQCKECKQHVVDLQEYKLFPSKQLSLKTNIQYYQCSVCLSKKNLNLLMSNENVSVDIVGKITMQSGCGHMVLCDDCDKRDCPENCSECHRSIDYRIKMEIM